MIYKGLYAKIIPMTTLYPQRITLAPSISDSAAIMEIIVPDFNKFRSCAK